MWVIFQEYTIWPHVIHVETVGMGLHSARATKNLVWTVMSVKVVMKMCFPQNLVVVARILPNHKTFFWLIDWFIDCIAITNCKSCEKNIAGTRTLVDKKLKWDSLACKDNY